MKGVFCAALLVPCLLLMGAEEGQPVPDAPAGLRYEVENVRPPYTWPLVGAFGQAASMTMSIYGVIDLPETPAAPLHAWIRYVCNEEQTFTFVCNGVAHDMPATDSLKWVYAGTVPDRHLDVGFVLNHQPRISGYCDSIVFLEDGDLDPNTLTDAALQAIPEIQPSPDIVGTILKENPGISPEEFGRKIVAAFKLTPPQPVAPFVSECGAIQWRGRPIFPITFYGTYVDDSRNRLADISATMDGRPRQVGDNRRLYRIGGLGTLRANDQLVRQLAATGGDPDMTMYYISDEPQLLGLTVQDLQYLNALHKAVDPATPTFINVAAGGHDESVVTISDYVGIDHYPVPSGRIYDIGDSVDCTRKASGGRPVVFVAQSFSWADDGVPDGRFPTSDEISAMTWQAVIHGCRGLWYYDFGIRGDKATCIVEDHPVEWQRLVEVIDMMRTIEPQLVGPETEFPGQVTTDGTEEHPLSWRLAVDAGRTEAVLIVANCWDEEREMTIDWQLPDVTLKPCLKHGVTADGNRLHFAPYGTGVFRVRTSSLDGLKTYTPEEALEKVRERLDRPVSLNEISLAIDGPACDLQDTWKSTNHFETATIQATADGLRVFVKQRFVKPAEYVGLERDGKIYSDPCIELFFGNPDRTAYSYLAVNTINVQSDMRAVCGPPFDFAVDYKWESKVDVKGEFAEYTVFIPWKTLAEMTGVERGGVFAFNLASTSSSADWSGLSGGSYHMPGRFGQVTIEEKP